MYTVDASLLFETWLNQSCSERDRFRRYFTVKRLSADSAKEFGLQQLYRSLSRSVEGTLRRSPFESGKFFLFFNLAASKIVFSAQGSGRFLTKRVNNFSIRVQT